MITSGGCRLYLVTPPALDLRRFPDLLARTLDAGDVAALQLRLKDAPEDLLRRAIDALRPVAQSRDVAFLLNDDPALATVTGCDGAHIGPHDMKPAVARRLLRDSMLGVSCGTSRDAAMGAGEDGADYVAFGAFFPSGTKPGAALAEPDLVSWWATLMELPCVAIGGITPENCAPLVQAGADFVAAISAIWQHPDGPPAGVHAMNAAIAAAQQG